MLGEKEMSEKQPLRLLVRDWMTESPQTISPNSSIYEALHKMVVGGYRHLLVESEGKLIGVISDRDLYRQELPNSPKRISDFYLNDDTSVFDVMTPNPITVRPEDHISKALNLLLKHRFHSLPVIDDSDKIVGILTDYDLMQAFSYVLSKAL